MTIRMYANHKGIDLEEVKVHLTRKKRYRDDSKDPSNGGKIEVIDREVELSGNLTAAQRERMIQIADRCPVHKTLSHGVVITTKEK